jgi:transposase
VKALAQQIQQVTGDTVELAYVDQGYTGAAAAEAAGHHEIHLEVVKHPMAKRGFVLLPRRWVVERSFAWAARFRRLARDYERLDTTLKGFHYLSFAFLMLTKMFHLLNATSQQPLARAEWPERIHPTALEATDPTITRHCLSG